MWYVCMCGGMKVRSRGAHRSVVTSPEEGGAAEAAHLGLQVIAPEMMKVHGFEEEMAKNRGGYRPKARRR
jgi:hypothetical protein